MNYKIYNLCHATTQEEELTTIKEIEIIRRMCGTNRSFHRCILALIKHFPFINKYFSLRCYNFLLRKINKKYYAITYFKAKLKCDPKEFIQTRILYFGFWEPNISALIESILERGDVFVDIGANIGYHSLLASKLVGEEGSVIAIEASPSIFEILSTHVRENNATNVRIINKAASDASGSLMIYRGPPENIGTATIMRSRSHGEDGIVESVPIDDILTCEERARLRLIKIDIEGGELPVLRRFLQTINLYPKEISLIVEVWSREDPHAWSDVFSKFRAEGFHAYIIENRHEYDVYWNWRKPAPLQLLEDIPSGESDILFRREVYRD